MAKFCKSIDKIKVVPAGVDINRFCRMNEDQSSGNDINIGFIGRLYPEKGSLILTEIIQKSIIDIPNAKFMIMGDGPGLNELKHLPNVVHAGWVPKNRLISYLQKMDIVLFFQESLGLAELEAMASEKVLIAYDTGEISKHITHLENGFLSDPDPQSYIYAIKYLIDHPSLRLRIAKKARETARDSYSWEIIANRWLLLCKTYLI